MKRAVVLLLVFGWIFSSLSAQISVNQADMPSVGDTIRVSLTNVVPAGYARTAMDTSWNFAALEALSQRVDTFASTASTPSVYQFVFVLQGGANLAYPRNSSPLPGLPISDGFTFFKNSAASYSELGSAYTIQGLPLPAKYDIPDKLYQFPLTPGLTWSSSSSFAMTVPDFAYYGTQRTRSNEVDGWGSLTTPLGTFQTIRVKSNLTIHDSIYVDSMGTGFSVNRNITEYKWLAKDKGTPVLQVSEEQNLATAIYQDIFRMSVQPLSVSLGPDTSVFLGTVLTMHATVTGGTPPYQILWNIPDTGSTVTVTIQNPQTFSVFVADALQNIGVGQKIVSIRYPPGFEDVAPVKLQIYPNPAIGMVHIALPAEIQSAGMEVFASQGNLVLDTRISPSAGEIIHDFSSLPAGLYFIRISAGEKVYSSRLQIVR
jgi:hypothetical protein